MAQNSGLRKNLESLKNLEFDDLGNKKLEKPEICKILKKNLEF